MPIPCDEVGLFSPYIKRKRGLLVADVAAPPVTDVFVLPQSGDPSPRGPGHDAEGGSIALQTESGHQRSAGSSV